MQRPSVRVSAHVQGEAQLCPTAPTASLGGVGEGLFLATERVDVSLEKIGMAVVLTLNKGWAIVNRSCLRQRRPVVAAVGRASILSGCSITTAGCGGAAREKRAQCYPGTRRDPFQAIGARTPFKQGVRAPLKQGVGAPPFKPRCVCTQFITRGARAL